MSDNMPDFDKMSQDEIMAWMETLAKRQGASEGFTTTADMDIAEVDPNTAVIDEAEGGYVPYGQERTQPVNTQPAAPAPAKPAAVTPPPAPPAAAAPPAQPPAPQVRPLTPTAAQPRPSMPSESAPPARPVAPPVQQPPQPIRTQTPPPAPVQPRPAAQPPQPPPQPVRAQTPLPAPIQQQPPTPPSAQPSAPPEAPAAQPPVDEGALAWLESLAADQGDELFNLDLSDLPSTESAASPAASVNPMTWLEDLARSQVAEPSLEQLGASDDDEEESEKIDPYAQGVNPIEWLETLAKRQGAKEEELTTRASMNIPAPPETEVEDDDYQPFSFDTPPTRRPPEPAAAENPADWLNSLAGSEGYNEEGVLATQMPEASAEDEPVSDAMSMPAIEDAIQQGTVTREQMQFFLEQQADQLADAPEEYYEEVEEDGPLAPAELPDWLSELKPPAPQAAAEVTQPIDALFEAPPVAEMPDWLRQDLLGESATSPDIESIFQPEEDSQIIEPVSAATAQPTAETYEIEVDTSDPWVEAFDEEYAQGGMADIDAVPAWYEQNLNDPARIAAVEGQTAEPEAANALEEAALPEENALSAGQPEAVPSWVAGFEPVEEQETTSANVFEEMPDWLREVEASVAPEDVPDWLVETIGEPEEESIFFEPVQEVVVEPPKPAPVVPPPPRPTPVAAAPAPKPAPAPAPAAARAVATGEAAAVIERARDKEQSGDLEGALAEYEAMIRGNSSLDAVVEELTLLVKSYKTTPAVYRVLGDGLMRQGKLQAALNTYREALNQL
ncbi:MAG: hypothetical protein GC204_06235 [Chloroflexi bacterium]|nr:hypothetical protein [Chloroflexota bacterium]